MDPIKAEEKEYMKPFDKFFIGVYVIFAWYIGLSIKFVGEYFINESRWYGLNLQDTIIDFLIPPIFILIMLIYGLKIKRDSK